MVHGKLVMLRLTKILEKHTNKWPRLICLMDIDWR